MKFLEMLFQDEEVQEEQIEKTAATPVEKSEEIELWRRWKTKKDKNALGELFDRYQGMFNNHFQKMKRMPLPDSVQKAEIQKWFINGLDTFDPNRGVALGTHVYNRMLKAKRLNYQYSNVAYIPEDSAIRIGTYKGVKSNLTDTLGRDPTTIEMADELSWHPNEIARVENSLIDESPESAMNILPWDQTSEVQDTMFYLHTELDPKDQLILEHTTGFGGKKLLTTNQMSRKLNMTTGDINKSKARIRNRLREFVL